MTKMVHQDLHSLAHLGPLEPLAPLGGGGGTSHLAAKMGKIGKRQDFVPKGALKSRHTVRVRVLSTSTCTSSTTDMPVVVAVVVVVAAAVVPAGTVQKFIENPVRTFTHLCRVVVSRGCPKPHAASKSNRRTCNSACDGRCNLWRDP